MHSSNAHNALLGGKWVSFALDIISVERLAFWAWLHYSRYSHLFQIAGIIALLIWIAHYIACIWTILLEEGDDFEKTFASWHDPSFYAALLLLQGEGVPANTAAQNLFASLSVVVGSIVLAVVFGHVAILVSNFNANTTSYQRKIEEVFAMTAKLQLPAPLRERIHDYYEHLWHEYECLEGEIVIFSKDLSHTLGLEVVLFKYMEVVMHAPFWKDCTPDFQKQLMLRLDVRVYLPNDFIMREGEVDDEFYMVNRGYCELRSDLNRFERVNTTTFAAVRNGFIHGNSARSVRRRSTMSGDQGDDGPRQSAYELDAAQRKCYRNGGRGRQGHEVLFSRGQACGDMALLMNYQRAANVRAVTHVEICVLSRDPFQTVLTKYPDDRQRVVVDMLASYMQSFESSKGRCPLLELVGKIYRPKAIAEVCAKTGGPVSHFPSILTARQAAERIYTAMNVEANDVTLIFGVGGGDRDRLIDLRERLRRKRERKMQTKDLVGLSPSASDGDGSHDKTEKQQTDKTTTELKMLQEKRYVKNQRKLPRAKPGSDMTILKPPAGTIPTPHIQRMEPHGRPAGGKNLVSKSQGHSTKASPTRYADELISQTFVTSEQAHQLPVRRHGQKLPKRRGSFTQSSEIASQASAAEILPPDQQVSVASSADHSLASDHRLSSTNSPSPEENQRKMLFQRGPSQSLRILQAGSRTRTDTVPATKPVPGEHTRRKTPNETTVSRCCFGIVPPSHSKASPYVHQAVKFECAHGIAMASSHPPSSEIKKRATPLKPSRRLSFTTRRPEKNAYKMHQKAAKHEQMMQRFQLRKVPTSRSVTNFGRDVVIDKVIGPKQVKKQRFSLHRFVRSIAGQKARGRALQALSLPITPDSWTYTVHGLLMLLVYHFQLLYLPFFACYFQSGTPATMTIAVMLETVFCLDLMLNFNTAYVDQGVLVKSRKKIARNYWRSWWITLDILSATPIQVIYIIIDNTNQNDLTIRGAHIALMVMRILRITFFENGVLLNRVVQVANQLADSVRYSRYSHLLGIAQLMWLVLLIAHYMACIWHVVSCPHVPSSIQTLSVGEQYVADYYYAVSLIQGQGNAVGTWDENIYSSIAIIVGSVILAIVFGNVAMLVSNFNANETNYHRKMEAVYATMDKMDLPLKLRERVTEYYAHVWLEYESLDGNINKFQQELTHTLRIEIGLYKFMNLIVKIPFWEDCSPDFLTQLVLNLGVRVYMPNDYVVRRREIGSEMMMINLGYCKLSKPLRERSGRRDVVSNTLDANLTTTSLQDDTSSRSALELIATSNSEDESDWDDGMSDDDSESDFKYHQPGTSLSSLHIPGSAFDIPRFDRRRSRRASDPSRGRVKPKPVYIYLKPGQAFGEMSLLMNYKRTASIRAVTFVEMCVLDRKTFQNIISRYAEDRRRVLTKMLESCIEKKEIPFPWENIIEAVSAKRRENGTIDINAPDESIKYGFQSSDHDFVGSSSLRQVDSARTKIRDTLHRRSSDMSSHRSYTRRNSIIDSSRSSACELPDVDDDSPTEPQPMPAKDVGSLLRLMQSMVGKIDKLQDEIESLRAEVNVLTKRAEQSESAHFTVDTTNVSTHTVHDYNQTLQLAMRNSHRQWASSHASQMSNKGKIAHESNNVRRISSARALQSQSDGNHDLHSQPPQVLTKRVNLGATSTSLASSPSASEAETDTLVLKPQLISQRRLSPLFKHHNSEHVSTLADLLWKRDSSSHIAKLSRSSGANRLRRHLKTRRSMPANNISLTSNNETSDKAHWPSIADISHGIADTSDYWLSGSVGASTLEYQHPREHVSSGTSSLDPR
ncbi:unnamed protein product [Phytophthora lilii]|uniref:Unnamed protein product n=1 Tax=Phytophthora lilii TaxID=2077276 RepID=A0A9W6X6H9_9STRA|nr:unnamed protein product [Phytophthora lilii]